MAEAKGLAPTLSPTLQRLTIPTGVHNRWLSILFFGGPKTGKSFAAASMPAPMLAIDCGDGGIGLYLPKDDPNYVCIQVTNPGQFQEAVDWALDHEDWLQSVVIDPMTLLWTDLLDFWNEELGGDIRGGDWRKVKGPWKANAIRLRRANFHLGMTAQLRDLEYTEGPAGPGEKGKLEIKAQEVPAIEKNMPYMVDFLLQNEVKLDKLNKPTDKHKLTFWGGRRPQSISPEDLHVGKAWFFDAKKPVNVWDEAIAPLLANWEDGAGEHIGVDPRKTKAEIAKAEQAAEDSVVGQLLAIISDQTDLGHYKDQVFPTEIKPAAVSLSVKGQAMIKDAHKKKVAELGGS